MFLNLQLNRACPGAAVGARGGVDMVKQSAVATSLGFVARRPLLLPPFELQLQVVVLECALGAELAERLAGDPDRGRPSTSPTTVNTLSGSRPAPIGSVYFSSASRFSPGTSEPGSGCRIHVVQPSRSLPFQSGVQPLAARTAIPPPSKTPMRSNRGRCISPSLPGTYNGPLAV